MKVSEKVCSINGLIDSAAIFIDVHQSNMRNQLIQLEVDVANALLTARQEGYADGFDSGYVAGHIKGKG